MWRTKTRVVVMVALGVTAKGFLDHLNLISGNLSSNEVHKIVFMDTAHIFKKMLG